MDGVKLSTTRRQYRAKNIRSEILNKEISRAERIDTGIDSYLNSSRGEISPKTPKQLKLHASQLSPGPSEHSTTLRNQVRTSHAPSLIQIHPLNPVNASEPLREHISIFTNSSLSPQSQYPQMQPHCQPYPNLKAKKKKFNNYNLYCLNILNKYRAKTEEEELWKLYHG